MRRLAVLALACALPLTLTGCGRYAGVLPYAREIEDMELIRTLGVDGGADGVTVTASGGTEEQGGATVVDGQAGSISAAVLAMQSQGSSYLYFGHVGQLLLGEDLARQGVETSLDYVLRDVEMRLETDLYLVKDGTAAAALTAAAQEGSASDRLDALVEDAGLMAGSMPRSVKDVLADLWSQGASFAPAVAADGSLAALGYGVLKDGALVAWAEGDAALGVNLIQSRVDADVVAVTLPDGTAAALRVVGASTKVRPVFTDGVLTGLRLTCKVSANLAEGAAAPGADQLAALEQALADQEGLRIRAALDLAQTWNADYLGLLRRAALAAPWHKQDVLGAALDGLDLDVSITAVIQRSYHAGG